MTIQEWEDLGTLIKEARADAQNPVGMHRDAYHCDMLARMNDGNQSVTAKLWPYFVAIAIGAGLGWITLEFITTIAAIETGRF